MRSRAHHGNTPPSTPLRESGYLIFKSSPNTSSLTTTLMPSPITITTSSKSTVTTEISPSTILTNSTSSTTTTTSSSVPIPCPHVLPQANHTIVLLSLDNTITLSDFTNYSIKYISAINASVAMLMFEFNTEWGSWYLDNVSMKKSSNNGEDIINNGGFEMGNLGSKWKFCDARYPWITDGTVSKLNVHSGNYSYESQGLDVGSHEYLAQIFDIESNTSYIIEFYLSCNGQSRSVKVTIISD